MEWKSLVGAVASVDEPGLKYRVVLLVPDIAREAALPRCACRAGTDGSAQPAGDHLLISVLARADRGVAPWPRRTSEREPVLVFWTPDVGDALGQGLEVYVRRNAPLALPRASSARRPHGAMLVRYQQLRPPVVGIRHKEACRRIQPRPGPREPLARPQPGLPR